MNEVFFSVVWYFGILNIPFYEIEGHCGIKSYGSIPEINIELWSMAKLKLYEPLCLLEIMSSGVGMN